MDRYWLSLITSVSRITGVPFADVCKMDVFEFFTLLEIADKAEK